MDKIFTVTVSKDSSEGPIYRGYKAIDLIKAGYNLIDVVFLILVGRFPSKEEARLAEILFMMVADNGACVSGAVNGISSARGNVPMPQALASAFGPVGPKFGGASTPAAKLLQKAQAQGIEPEGYIDFVLTETCSKRAPGFGHRKYNADNPDSRVLFFIEQAMEILGEEKLVHVLYARSIEEFLTKKKEKPNPKLILNIDGLIGAILLDIGVPVHAIDAFFLWPRALGFLGHICDQAGQGADMFRLEEELVEFKDLEVKEVPEKSS